MPLQEVAKARADAQRTLWLATARGAYDEPVGVRSADEIGTLANASDTTRKQVALTTGELRRERDVLSAVLEAADGGHTAGRSVRTDRPGKRPLGDIARW